VKLQNRIPRVEPRTIIEYPLFCWEQDISANLSIRQSLTTPFWLMSVGSPRVFSRLWFMSRHTVSAMKRPADHAYNVQPTRLANEGEGSPVGKPRSLWGFLRIARLRHGGKNAPLTEGSCALIDSCHVDAALLDIWLKDDE
jgi:hypothetical protein